MGGFNEVKQMKAKQICISEVHDTRNMRRLSGLGFGTARACTVGRSNLLIHFRCR